jgi:hypothetical protein
MKTYSFVRDANHACTLYVLEAGRTLLPMSINSDERPAWRMMTVATLLLLDCFEGEEQAEVKATLMAGALAHFLNCLGDSWTLSEGELNKAVIAILVAGKRAISEAAEDICFEYAKGQSRDSLPLQ